MMLPENETKRYDGRLKKKEERNSAMTTRTTTATTTTTAKAWAVL